MMIGLSVVLLSAVALLSFACGTVGTNDPERVVSRFWVALEKNDQDTMLDCIEPSLRPGLGPFSQVVPPGTDWLITLLRWLRTRTGKQLVEFGRMSYEELDNNGSIAHIRVTGRVKVSKDIPLIGGIVREFQLTHTLVKKDGEWYLTSPR
jgi:hypothetical protein